MTASAPLPIRILVADDHDMVRDGLKRVLDEQDDMKVVAEAANSDDALRLVESLRPRIVLLDVSLPGHDGVWIAGELARRFPYVRSVGVTRHNDGAFVARLLHAGASGYVLKQSPSSELVRAVRAVAAGAQYIDPAIGLPAGLGAAPPRAVDAPAPGEELLTAREESVLRLVAGLWSHQSIADRLEMDLNEVIALKTAAMTKMGLKTRIQLVDYSRSRGWTGR